MAKQVVKKGDTSRIEYVFIQDSSSTTGAGLTGLAFNSAGLTAYYVRTGGTATAITLATQTANGAYSSGGFVAVDGTNMPGVYRLDIPDAVFATGVDKAVVMLKGATNMAQLVLEYQLVDYDPENATTLGLTNLDATVSSRLASASISLSGGAVTVGTNNDKTGYALADVTSDAVIADAVWNGATASYGAAGSYGALIETNLDTAVSTRSTLDAAGVRTAVGLAAANLDTQLTAIDDYLDTEVAAIKAKTDQLTFTTANQVDATTVTNSDKTGYSLSNAGIDALFTRALTESYSADGATFTVAQALYEIAQSIGDFSISGTTITVKKRDGSTSAMTYTLDDGTNPTSRTRAT